MVLIFVREHNYRILGNRNGKLPRGPRGSWRDPPWLTKNKLSKKFIGTAELHTNASKSRADLTSGSVRARASTAGAARSMRKCGVCLFGGWRQQAAAAPSAACNLWQPFVAIAPRGRTVTKPIARCAPTDDQHFDGRGEARLAKET